MKEPKKVQEQSILRASWTLSPAALCQTYFAFQWMNDNAWSAHKISLQPLFKRRVVRNKRHQMHNCATLVLAEVQTIQCFENHGHVSNFLPQLELKTYN